MTLYNVCNDYSLDKTDEKPVNGTVRWFEREVIVNGESVKVELGYDRKHKELHYLRANNEKLQGKRIMF